jgi:hypothetical protein
MINLERKKIFRFKTIKYQLYFTDIVNRVNMTYLTESCTSLKRKLLSTMSELYTIHPKGLNSPVQVHCNMSSKNGTGVTEIGHDSESRTLVSGYEDPGTYMHKVKYDLPMEQIVAIIQQSQWCEQFIKYECHATVMWWYGKSLAGSWVSRDGVQMNYWGGAAVDSGKCACGMTNSCAGGGRCNCDKNDGILREDSGYLTDKATLPVTELRFGDTGSSYEYGYHTLGKLQCWG